MDKKELDIFAQLLNKEKLLLETELSSVGRKDPSLRGEWEASQNEENTETAEIEGRAEEIAEFEDRNAIEMELSYRLREVNNALSRIDEGKYGVCTICGKNIEKERLMATAAAHTCKTHRDS